MATKTVIEATWLSNSIMIKLAMANLMVNDVLRSGYAAFIPVAVLG